MLPPHQPKGLLSTEHSSKPVTSNDGINLTILVSVSVTPLGRQVRLAASGRGTTLQNHQEHDCAPDCDQIVWQFHTKSFF